MSRRNKPVEVLEAKKKAAAESVEAKKTKGQNRFLVAIWIFTLLILLVPVIYGFFLQKSSGQNTNTVTFSSWFSGNYQGQQERHSKKNWAFATFFSRVNNQIDYSLLNRVNVAGFVKGKENQLYESDYIRSYMGQDYIGEDSIRTVLGKLKVVADSLKKNNIDLMIVYAPGKPTCYPEYLPSGYGRPTGQTNLNTFVKVSGELGLNYIDMQNWFLGLRQKVAYLLFPPFGLHWSYYGECLAEDSIIKYIERLRDRHLPNWRFVDPVLGDPYRIRDADVIARLNLFWIPSASQLAYPKIGVVKNSTINTCKVLGIGDSYYFGIHYDKIQRFVFNHGDYWRYYNTIVSDTANDFGNQTKEIWEVDLKQELEKNQVILLMISDRNLTNFGWGFVQDAYLMYTNPSAYESLKKQLDQINPFKKQVRLDPELMDELALESQQKNIPLDTLITRKAMERMKSGS